MTYAQGLVDGLAVGMVVFVVSVSTLLARHGGSAFPGSSRCYSAEGLHGGVGGVVVLVVGSSMLELRGCQCPLLGVLARLPGSLRANLTLPTSHVVVRRPRFIWHLKHLMHVSHRQNHHAAENTANLRPCRLHQGRKRKYWPIETSQTLNCKACSSRSTHQDIKSGRFKWKMEEMQTFDPSI